MLRFIEHAFDRKYFCTPFRLILKHNQLHLLEMKTKVSLFFKTEPVYLCKSAVILKHFTLDHKEVPTLDSHIPLLVFF